MQDLTLLICCHNHGRFIPHMLADIANQTLDFRRWKVCIIFDECTDNSENVFYDTWDQLCHYYPLDDLDYDIFIRDKKEGLAACKNFGLERCHTEFIAYLDVDDGMFSQKLEMQLDLLQSQEGQDVDICGTNSWDRDSKGKLLVNCFSIGQYETHNQIADQLRKENVMCHGSVMLRKKAIDDVGGYRESKECLGQEDYDLWLRMLHAGKRFYNIPERLYIWSMNTSTER